MLGNVECPHLNVEDFSSCQMSDEMEHHNRINLECHICERRNGNLWMCLRKDCLKVFCSDVGPGHSFSHFKKDLSHCLHMNVTNFRIWCHQCNFEVKFESAPDEFRPTGLVGLQNLGNTCYMNAALQSLANTQPLADFFLHLSPNSVPRLQVSRAFHKLLIEIWSQENGCVAPHGVLYAIRRSHPMYRGFHQHDSQEFLRSLLDQIHEEMKIPFLEICRSENYGFDQREELSDFDYASSDNEDYETCDSGVSEKSSNSDQISQKMLSRTPSPVLTDSGFWNLQNSQSHLGSSISPSNKPRRQLSYRSIVSDVFNGSLLSSVQCLSCNRISSRVETFQDLSLPIPGRETIYLLHQNGNGQPTKCGHLVSSDQGWLSWIWECMLYWIWGPQISLHDCLSAFFSADELKGDNMYSCEKCQKLRNGIKYSRLLQCPEVLCIHLKRFRHEPTLSSKISSHISFPLEDLDMSQYMVPDSPGGLTKYSLSSVICHHGAGGSSGHYTCLAKSRTTARWYEFDDISVNEIPESSVTSARAYVLFYRKDSEKIERARTRTAKLIEVSKCDYERFYLSKCWLQKFYSFSEPGPIDNRLLLCPHSHISPGIEYAVVSETVWKYLLTRFGGGPECPFEKMNICEICSEITNFEFDTLRLQWLEFNRLQNIGLNEPHHISQMWLKNWEDFVKGKSSSHPGPINNQDIFEIFDEKFKVTVRNWYNRNPGKTEEISGGRWEFLCLLYGVLQGNLMNSNNQTQISISTQDISDSDTRSLEDRTSMENLDSGIWLQNISEKGSQVWNQDSDSMNG